MSKLHLAAAFCLATGCGLNFLNKDPADDFRGYLSGSLAVYCLILAFSQPSSSGSKKNDKKDNDNLDIM